MQKVPIFKGDTMTDRMVKNKVSNLKTRKKVSWFTDFKPLDSAFSYHFKESKVPQKGTKLTTDALNAAMTAAVREVKEAYGTMPAYYVPVRSRRPPAVQAVNPTLQQQVRTG